MNPIAIRTAAAKAAPRRAPPVTPWGKPTKARRPVRIIDQQIHPPKRHKRKNKERRTWSFSLESRSSKLLLKKADAAARPAVTTSSIGAARPSSAIRGFVRLYNARSMSVIGHEEMWASSLLSFLSQNGHEVRRRRTRRNVPTISSLTEPAHASAVVRPNTNRLTRRWSTASRSDTRDAGRARGICFLSKSLRRTAFPD